MEWLFHLIRYKIWCLLCKDTWWTHHYRIILAGKGYALKKELQKAIQLAKGNKRNENKPLKKKHQNYLMAIIIPETMFQNAFVMTIHESPQRKEMQQCMQQKWGGSQPRERTPFPTGSSTWNDLANSILLPLFCPKFTTWIWRENSLLMLLSFHHQVVNIVSRPVCHGLCFQKENISTFPHFVPIWTGHGHMVRPPAS